MKIIDLRKKSNGVFYVVISLVAILAIGSIAAIAYSDYNNTRMVAEGDINIQNYNEATNEAPEEVNLGASPGPERYAYQFCDNEVCYQATSLSMQASTTPCSIKSPSATSTLTYASYNFVVASSTEAVVVTIAKGSTGTATTTQIGTDIAIAANAQATVMASSSPTTATDASVVFAPNTYLVLGIQGYTSYGTGINPYSGIQGRCKAIFNIVY